VVKWWKPADHPDFAGSPEAQVAAAHRLAERPAKLRALPGNLPPEVVVPCGFALAGRRSAEVVGCLLPRVTGEPLHSYGEPRWRRDHPIDGVDLVAALIAMHDAIDRLHRAGVVIGDCNDLNVLVDGRRVHLIDVDSYQFGGYTCPMFSERFVDPRIGGVLAGLTRAWAGARLGVGFYRAGGYAVGFVFHPGRGVLDDRVALPPIRGQLVAAHATIGDDRAWLWLTLAAAGRLTTTCVVIGADASVLAADALADAPWLAGITGACAAGPHLFVPTDDGVARVEIVQGAIVQTRTFAETAPLVAAGDRLALHPTGLDAIRRHDAIRMHLT